MWDHKKVIAIFLPLFLLFFSPGLAFIGFLIMYCDQKKKEEYSS